MVTTFQIDANRKIVGHTQSSRTGFKHLVKFYNGERLVETRSVNYYNRTWESYDYESAIHLLLEKMVKNRDLTKEEAGRIEKHCSDIAHGRIKERFGSIAMVAKMGEIFTDNKKDEIKWKERMIKAGLPGVQMPEDWDTLPDAEKEKRLKLVINQLGKK